MTDERIRGQVAQLLSERELVINRGIDQGVEVGMTFAVLNRRGVEIVDPSTKEVIGSVDLPKILVKIIRVDDRIAVARTYRTRRVNRGGRGNDFGIRVLEGMFDPPRWEEVPETLKTAEKPSAVEIDPEDSFIKIGDPVVENRDDEYLLPE